MTLEELQQFIQESHLEDIEDEDVDKCGNMFCSKIFKNRNKLFRILFLNGKPQEKYGAKGYEKNVYEAEEVEKHIEQVEFVFYESKKQHE
jgi:hypothetical protein